MTVVNIMRLVLAGRLRVAVLIFSSLMIRILSRMRCHLLLLKMRGTGTHRVHDSVYSRVVRLFW